MDDARKEMSEEIAKAGLNTASRSNVPAAAERSFSVGDQVLLYKERPVNKWLGPFLC